MHTVRNRLASRPPKSSVIPAGRTPPSRQDLAFVPRGSMALPLTVAEESGLIETRAQRRRNPKGKKTRKAAARLAKVREAQALEPPRGDIAETPPRAKPAARKGHAKPKVAANADQREAARPEQLPAIPAASAVVGTYSPPLTRASARTTPALPLSVRHEPLVELEPLCALSLSAKPDRIEPAATTEPLLLLPAPEPATALAALVDAPLPRARALVPARRQGLVDVIAFLLRDSGRRLARWSARRHKTRAEQAALRRAEARQINLQRELEALDALRRAKG